MASKSQEKKGKLIVRQKLRDKSLGMHKGIGIANISLHTFAGTFEPTRVCLPLTQCSKSGAEVVVVVTSKILGNVMKLYILCMCVMNFFSRRLEMMMKQCLKWYIHLNLDLCLLMHL